MEEQLGNHRAIIRTAGKRDFVYAKIPWRLRDEHMEKKRLIIQDDKGRIVQNIKCLQINKEFGGTIFHAIPGATNYYVYYMPFKGEGTNGSWKGKYLGPEEQPEEQWLQTLIPSDKQESAQIIKFESRTAFDSFFPMEVCATAQEVANLKIQFKQDYLLFPEDRLNSIRMTDDLPYR